MAKGYFFAKVVSRHEDEKMSNDFENSQEYRKAHEITKKQEELYKNVTKAISPEVLAKFQELSNKLSEWKNSLNNMPGLLKFAEMLKNYQQEVRVTEGLTEAEFEENIDLKLSGVKSSEKMVGLFLSILILQILKIGNNYYVKGKQR